MGLKYKEEPINYPGPDIANEYRRYQKMIIICEKCGEQSIKYRINIKYPIICSKCAKKIAFQNKDWTDRNNKSKQTKLKKYGNEYYVNPEKISQSLKNRPENLKKETIEKTKITNLKKYGGHPATRESQKEITKQTCLEKYGGPSPSCSNIVKEKIKQTCLERYGVENVWQSEKIKEKIKQTNLIKYNIDNPRKNDIINEKIKQTCLEKYGVDHPWKNHDIRLKCQQSYLYDNINFDSSWELYLYIYLKDNNISFKYQPNIYFIYLNDKRYFPDFEIEGKYYEIKGNHFFKNGKMINPYDRNMDNIYEAKYQCMINNNITILFKNDLIKVFNYIDNKYGKNYIKQFKKKIKF